MSNDKRPKNIRANMANIIHSKNYNQENDSPYNNYSIYIL